tara:strand:- start:1252 stop:1890 length:639 start_codon:yes stop_codon:yes gene_type:complete
MSYKIPTDLKDITCLQWYKMQEAIKLIDNEPLLKATLISNILDITLDKVVKFKMSDINSFYEDIMILIEQKPELSHFTIDGLNFGFIPNLEQMSGAEFIDAESYFDNDIFSLMAVVYRPIKKEIGKSYSIEKYKGADKYRELMAKAPASAYVSARFFFLNLVTDLISVIPSYILKNLTTSEVALLERNGVGMSQLTNLLEATDLNIKALLVN